MIKLTVDPGVEQALHEAFPRPAASARKALTKYVKLLELLLLQAHMRGLSPQQRKLGTYGLSLAQLQEQGEVDKIKWNDGLQQSSIDSITPVAGATPATLASLNVSYVRNLDAAPPFKTYIQTRNVAGGLIQSDSKLLPVDPSYTSGSLVTVSLNNSGVAWNNPQTTVPAADTYNWIELVSRNKFGTILDRMWRY